MNHQHTPRIVPSLDSPARIETADCMGFNNFSTNNNLTAIASSKSNAAVSVLTGKFQLYRHTQAQRDIAL